MPSDVAIPPYPRDVPEKQIADLAAARARSGIDASRMTAILFSPDATAKRRRALAIVEREPLLTEAIAEWPFIGRTERMRRLMPIVHRLAQIKLENGFARDDMLPIYNILGFATPLFNHEQTFFAAGLSSNASPEQMAYWGPLGEEYRFIGCYAQTELGHGSNVSALETTATYDPSTQEFVMNTPTLSATKWWIGALGTMATHALVMAKLILNGKDMGTAPFMVPIRDMKTHEPLPGVWCGDIGPKVGAATIDNGFLRLDHVRIPRENMLSRNSSVTPEGQFVRPKHEKLFLGGMLVRRTEITASSARALAKACTVGVRYGEVRRQNWGIGPTAQRHGEEAVILTYPMVQMRILVPLSAAYAFNFTGAWLVNFFTNYRAQFLDAKDDGFLDTLSDFHPTLSGLKSYCTTVAADGIEDIRRCLGGHGFSLASGLGTLYRNYVSTNTVEGENILMTQQASRYLMKQARSLSGKGDTEALRTRLGRSPVTAYLSTLFRPDAPCRATSHAEFQDPQIQIAAFNHRARRLVEECFEAVQKHQGDLGTAAPYAAALSVAHTQNLIVSLFWAKIWELEKSGADASCVAMLKKLANLHSLSLIQKHAAEFLEDGYLSGMQIKQAREALYSLLPQVRVDAVSLVDAWDIPDLELQSQLGRYDGNAYESYFKWVMQEPVNQGKGGKGVIPGYEAYLKPMIDGRVAAEARKVREANKARL